MIRWRPSGRLFLITEGSPVCCMHDPRRRNYKHRIPPRLDDLVFLLFTLVLLPTIANERGACPDRLHDLCRQYQKRCRAKSIGVHTFMPRTIVRPPARQPVRPPVDPRTQNNWPAVKTVGPARAASTSGMGCGGWEGAAEQQSSKAKQQSNSAQYSSNHGGRMLENFCPAGTCGLGGGRAGGRSAGR